jgi:hypothetical protein
MDRYEREEKLSIYRMNRAHDLRGRTARQFDTQRPAAADVLIYSKGTSSFSSFARSVNATRRIRLLPCWPGPSPRSQNDLPD